ncbi:MAG: winged helix-turn-helix transcriptional regulator [Alphaproteobacteria bacterium]|nr:winged helix-turn-helix transcriptional regulator [Alphaproteobacteria bacterium]
MSGLDATLAALADPARRGVIELLRVAPRRPSAIAAALALDRPATSRHLRVLRRAGLVLEEIQAEDARARVYHLRREPFDELQVWLAEVGAFWADQLGAFKAHAEEPRGTP